MATIAGAAAYRVHGETAWVGGLEVGVGWCARDTPMAAKATASLETARQSG